MLDAELGRQAADDLDEATADEADRESEALEGSDKGAGTRRQDDVPPHLGEHRLRKARQRGHPSPERLLEVELAGHGPSGHGSHLLLAPAVRGEQLDDLLLDQRRVDVEDHEAASAARQPARSDGDVNPRRRCDEGQLVAQRGHEGAADVELDRRHGVARQPPDPVDVRAVVGDPGRDQAHGVGEQGRAEDDDGGAALPGPCVVPAALEHGEREPEPMRRHSSRIAQLVGVVTGIKEQGQGEVPVHGDLLDVEHLGAGPADGSQDGAGHTGSVLAGQRQAQGLDVLARHGRKASQPGSWAVHRSGMRPITPRWSHPSTATGPGPVQGPGEPRTCWR
jgi:hypothetical protein